MNATKILERLVVNFWGACEQPEVSKAVMLARSTFRDNFTADFVTTLVLCDGDCEKAIYELRGNGHPQDRITRLREWIQKVKRGGL